MAGEERDFEIATGVKMRFCWIPAGEARLGSPATEADRLDNEKEHDFQTDGFWLGKYEVTQGEYEAVMGRNPSAFQLPRPAAGKFTRDQKGSGRHPVERVNWHDCQKFIKNCEVAGYKIRLPHEDEWEYACRGGKGNEQPFYWGHESNGDQANNDGQRPYGTKTKGPYRAGTTAVGSYEARAPHPWGVCDMLGNVKEWCDNAEGLGFRMVRGGGWRHPGAFCRSASRVGINASAPFKRTDGTVTTGEDTGFRIALVASK
jgi:formylglycine-generating enzyme required for sulfatase activity